MTREEFAALAASKIILLDGATGTELIKRGLPSGACPEAWLLDNPDAILEVQGGYAQAGADIVFAPTFGGNRLKLAEFGLQAQCRQINMGLVELSKKAAPQCLVFGDLAPTGQFLQPSGDFPFEEALQVYKEQASALLEAGVDGFVVETMMDVQEARAALLALRELCQLPVMVSLTFEAGQRTLTGNHPVAALITMQALGADAFGCNCSSGPEEMCSIIAMMKPYAKIPLLAKPNAGLPCFRDGQTSFSMQAEAFGLHAQSLFEAGAGILGGCCGTDVTHIKALHERFAKQEPPALQPQVSGLLSSARSYERLDRAEPFKVIGERINPTGKKQLQAELLEGRFELLLQYAEEQQACGAQLLEVNVGMPGIDEAETMREAVMRLSRSSTLPLCIDCTKPEVAEAALRLYPGRALFNSISAEPERLQQVLPIAAKYGAMLIILPLAEEGIPKTLEERINCIEVIIKACQQYGYERNELCIDALIMTISADQAAAELSLQQLAWCKDQGLLSVCGLSNVSFGLPRRDLINQAFLAMAISQGLNLAIINPLQQELMHMKLAAEALSGKDRNARAFCEHFAQSKTVTKTVEAATLEPAVQLRQALLSGKPESMPALLEKCLAAGHKAQELVNQVLIPGITEVGERYERKEYFLPQLMLSAEAMQKSMTHLEPLLARQRDKEGDRPKIILATVKGDVHDIGKNIVAIMLNNHGFEVIDLGKDRSAAEILDAAQEQQVRLIGLSALMTTTMSEMRLVIELAQKRGMHELQFMLGGAVLDQQYADSLGAHYAADALGAVKLARQLLA